MLSLLESPQAAAAAELLTRRRIRASFTEFCRYALRPFGHEPARHHMLLIRELEAVACGETDRLMVLMPPGSAKSTYASVLFPAWYLAQGPDRSLIGASSTSDLALSFSRRVMQMVRDNSWELDISLTREAEDLWGTNNGGQYRSAGIGGSITGFRADLAIIDDPVKTRAAADSPAEREKAWSWYISTLRTRIKPNGSIVLIQTRWHEDDLAGRLLDVQSDGWRVLSLPATAVESDALGRRPGELLWSDTPEYPYADELRRMKLEAETSGDMRDWSALFEQNPRPLEGALFKIGNIEVLDAAPALRGAQIARGWDLAATSQSGTRDPDWTVGVLMARLASGMFVVLDVFRDRGGPDRVDGWIRNTADQDGAGVKISIPQDPGQAGKGQVAAFARVLSGHSLHTSPETGDKATRAAPVVSQVNAGNLAIVRGPWNKAFLAELAAFPSGAKDDQVDALSRAFSQVGLARLPVRFSPEALAALGMRR